MATNSKWLYCPYIMYVDFITPIILSIYQKALSTYRVYLFSFLQSHEKWVSNGVPFPFIRQNQHDKMSQSSCKQQSKFVKRERKAKSYIESHIKFHKPKKIVLVFLFPFVFLSLFSTRKYHKERKKEKSS